MDSSSPENLSGDWKQVLQKVIQARKSANKLLRLISRKPHHGDDKSLVSADDLPIKILESSTESILEFNRPPIEQKIPVQKSEDSEESSKSTSVLTKRRGDRVTRITPELIDDGHAWREYGQKAIPGAKHPRYEQGCLATKQVQKTEEDPPMYQTTYYGIHTCAHLIESPSSPSSSMLQPVWPCLNFWYYHAIISSPSWVFSFLAMDFIKKTTGLVHIFLISTLVSSCFASNLVFSMFYFSLGRNPETHRFFRGYERAGKTVGYALLFFGNVGLYYFSEKSVACMLTFLFLAVYGLCTLFCIQPYTDFGALEFLLSACMNQTLSLFGLRSSYSCLVIIACVFIGGIRYCLEPVYPFGAEAANNEVQLKSRQLLPISNGKAPEL